MLFEFCLVEAYAMLTLVNTIALTFILNFSIFLSDKTKLFNILLNKILNYIIGQWYIKSSLPSSVPKRQATLVSAVGRVTTLGGGLIQVQTKGTNKRTERQIFFDKLFARRYSNSASDPKNCPASLSGEKAIIVSDDSKPVKCYDNASTMKANIIKENKRKSGIYRITNKINGKIYIGSSKDLGNRFIRYFNLAYISTVKNHLTISRALIAYGYANFIIEILEYCEIQELLIREQFYMDLLKPEYNIAKVAGSTLGVKPSEITKKK